MNRDYGMPFWEQILSLSTKIYGWMLWCYPRQFRREYGVEMMRLFDELARDAVRTNGCVGFVLFCGRILPDLAISSIEQRIDQILRSYRMFQNCSRYTRYWLALVIALTIAMFVTPADPVSQVIVALPFFLAYVILDILRAGRPAKVAQQSSR